LKKKKQKKRGQKMNKWTGIGNLTKDVELSTTPNGVSVAKFTIAVSRRFANADGERETDFINCVAWRNQAENLAKYCHKGDKVAVVGALQTRSYEAQDGTKRYVTEIVADEVEFLNTKKDGDKADKRPELTPLPEAVQDKLPF
jgi:single-strand DNA-binding protein